MKRLFLIRKPELFQGEKFLALNKEYFEGWYFKNDNGKEVISFIPGISINKGEKKAFIQVITNDCSYYVDYNIKEFKFSYEPFFVRVGNNYFSHDSVHIDIKDDKEDLVIYGDIRYYNSKNIDTSSLSPNIMGPFSYVPFMECNHAIISMKNKINGLITINNKKIEFNEGTGYIEKDWGCSFPGNYVWCQGNSFRNDKVSFMLSIADIPFKVFNFRGLICVLMIGDKEYRFATYNGAKVIRYRVDNDSLRVTLKKGNYYLEVESKYEAGFRLSAPVKGKMEKDIIESISSIITTTLKKNDRIIFRDTSINCGLEIVN